MVYTVGSRTIGSRVFVIEDGRLTLSDSVADDTIKLGRVGTLRYDIDQSVPFDAFVARTSGAFQTADIGGGQGDAHAATEVRVFTAANNTTLTGTLLATMSLTADLWLRRGGALMFLGDGTSSPQIIRAKSNAGFTTDWWYSGGVVAANRRWNITHNPTTNDLAFGRRDASGSAVDFPLTFEFSTGYVRIANRVVIGASSGPQIIAGSGSPEGAITAPVGSTYHRTDGGAGTSFYVKESGAGSNGWVPK